MGRYFELVEDAGTTLWDPDSYDDLDAVTHARHTARVHSLPLLTESGTNVDK